MLNVRFDIIQKASDDLYHGRRGDRFVRIGVCATFFCHLFPNHTNLNYINGWGLYGEFRYKCNPTRWLRITRQQV